jgi:hypothetical protein
VQRDEVTRGWTELLSEELLNLNSSPIAIGMMKSLRLRWGRLLVAKSGRKRQMLRPRRRWADNIKIYFG